MEKFYLKCKTCDTEFAAGISADKKSFEAIVDSLIRQSCPEGHTNTYDRKDYYFKD